MSLPIALSPCPNDTFLFHAWIAGLVGEHLPPLPSFGDIQILNEWAYEERFPLIKVSFHCFKKIQQSYSLLPVGAALGFNCGPKIVAKTPFPLEELSTKRIAIPGVDTTTHLLLNRLCPPPAEKHFCLYHEIGALLNKGEVDCGIIIHESRFTFQEEGFVEIADLGSLWHTATSLPLPLGALAVHHSLPQEKVDELTSIVRDSLIYARSHPDASRAFILSHSQEKDPEVVAAHIALYVNDETHTLSPEGLAAIECLLQTPLSLHSCV